MPLKPPGLRLPRFADALAAAFLVLLNLLLYRKVVRLWWTYDDPNILRTLFDFTALDPFVNGTAWPQQLFTPLMVSAFELQMAAFGLQPARWYMAHLAFACVTVLAVYAAARCFLETLPSFSAAVIFAAGVPLCSVVTQLSTVHYFLAITLGACATIAYVAALRRGSVIAAAGSALLYLAAMLAKEVAVPLPLLLVFLPLRDLRTRTRFAIGHGLALIGYFVWRHAVLGTFLGAYGWVIDTPEWPRLLMLLPWKLIRAAAGTNLTLGLLLLAIVAIVIVAAVRRRHALFLLAMGLIVAVGPLLPVAKEINRRVVVVPWLAVAVAFAACAAMLANRRLATALLIFVPLLAVVVNRQEWGHEFGIRQRMSDEARFVFESLPVDGLLRKPAAPPAVLRELTWLKVGHLKRAAGGSWFYDDYFLCANGAAGKRVWEYDAARRMPVEITASLPATAQRHCSTTRTTAQLSADFRFRKQALYWDLGPYAEGRYTVLLGDGVEAYEVPRHDALNLPGTDRLALRIRYDSPEGWTTYSPELALDFVKQPDFSWKR